MRVNKWQREAAFCPPGCGVRSLPMRGSTGTGVCRPPVGAASKQRKAGEKEKEKRRWDAGKWGEEKKHMQSREKEEKHKDAISESAKNKVSSVSLTKATMTSSRHTRASASTVLPLSVCGWVTPSWCCLPPLLAFFFNKKQTKPTSGQPHQCASVTAFGEISLQYSCKSRQWE